jgi:hypothetical protein
MTGTKSADYIQKAGFKKLEESYQELSLMQIVLLW